LTAVGGASILPTAEPAVAHLTLVGVCLQDLSAPAGIGLPLLLVHRSSIQPGVYTMTRLLTRITLLLAMSATPLLAHAWFIESVVDSSLCMSVQGAVSEGTNVQLQKCASADPEIHRNWSYIDNRHLCMFESGSFFCVDYREGAVDAIVTKLEPWKANQIWIYDASDKKFHGVNNQCLDVNELAEGGPGQIKVSTCEDWKQNQQWK
jgi:hypothetical protein